MLKSDFRREDKASVSFCPELLSPHTHCLHTSTLNVQRKENSQKLLAPRAWRHLVQKTTNPWPVIFPLISSYLQAAHREGQRFPKTRALIIKSNRPDLNRELLAMRLPQQPSTARYTACFQEAAWVRVDSTYSMNRLPASSLGTEQTREPSENQSMSHFNEWIIPKVWIKSFIDSPQKLKNLLTISQNHTQLMADSW